MKKQGICEVAFSVDAKSVHRSKNEIVLKSFDIERTCLKGKILSDGLTIMMKNQLSLGSEVITGRKYIAAGADCNLKKGITKKFAMPCKPA